MFPTNNSLKLNAGHSHTGNNNAVLKAKGVIFLPWFLSFSVIHNLSIIVILRYHTMVPYNS